MTYKKIIIIIFILTEIYRQSYANETSIHVAVSANFLTTFTIISQKFEKKYNNFI